MNHFESLPDDIQDKIYFEVHKLKCKDTFKKIRSIDFWHRDDVGYSILAMTNLLYQYGATQREIRDYYFCLDWIDGKILNITIEHVFENKYYHVYHAYWERVAESEYYNGDYI